MCRFHIRLSRFRVKNELTQSQMALSVKSSRSLRIKPLCHQMKRPGSDSTTHMWDCPCFHFYFEVLCHLFVIMMKCHSFIRFIMLSVSSFYMFFTFLALKKLCPKLKQEISSISSFSLKGSVWGPYSISEGGAAVIQRTGDKSVKYTVS